MQNENTPLYQLRVIIEMALETGEKELIIQSINGASCEVKTLVSGHLFFKDHSKKFIEKALMVDAVLQTCTQSLYMEGDSVVFHLGLSIHELLSFKENHLKEGADCE